jgi:hypothetical protein
VKTIKRSWEKGPTFVSNKMSVPVIFLCLKEEKAPSAVYHRDTHIRATVIGHFFHCRLE